MNVYGPVPSRRLGRSLGINNIPSKVCPYSCVYCQVGRTTHLQAARSAFLSPEVLVAEVAERVEKLRGRGENVDYLSFVPNGEPTLDVNLGRTIELLKPLGIRIAVITNASLLWRAEVREDLSKADWVSVKVDTVREDLWRKLNRPHPSLRLTELLDGIRAFAEVFQGELETETMLVRGVNDSGNDLKRTGTFIARLDPARACLSAPVRPPAELWVEPPTEDMLNTAFQIYRECGLPVEMLVEFEGTYFSSTGDIGEDLLAITAVHPMREDAVREFLARRNGDWHTVRELIEEGHLVETEYGGSRFFVRKYQQKRLNRF
ncbi:MAG: radical SAM protein [Geobacteraceae bacterium]|nr:radical SAM protein [Geobacteraceae bacterium]